MLVWLIAAKAPSTMDPIETTTLAPSTTTAVTVVQLEPIRIDCTSELAAFPCDALIDGDPNNSWNATEGGEGAEAAILAAATRTVRG